MRCCPARSCIPAFGAIGAHGYGGRDQRPTPSFNMRSLRGIFFSWRLTVSLEVAICNLQLTAYPLEERAVSKAKVFKTLAFSFRIL